MNHDVICFGSLNVDMLYKVNRIAREDEESFIIEFNETPGGSAANTAVGLARLGLKTGFIGKVSDDREGRLLLDAFKKESVNTEGIIESKEGRSGAVIGFVDVMGERALYVSPGVNDSINLKEISWEYACKTDYLHLTAFVGEKSFNAQKKLVETLPNIRVSLDPGAFYARRGLKALKSILKKSFVFFPNENEIRLLTGKDYRKGSKVIIDEGVNMVAVKLGAKGCYVSDGKESHLISAYEKDLVDTTGAGDAFCAGFLYGLVKGKDLYTCGKLGNFVASRCVQKVGAREGLPRISELKAMATAKISSTSDKS